MMQQIRRIISLLVLVSAGNQARAELIEYSDALRTVYGELPREKMNISVKTDTDNSNPVPCGQVTMSTLDEVFSVINPDACFKQVSSDWTAFHKLSHRLIPYKGYGNLWFSEGLATCYQNIIQARAGLMSETRLWNKLVSGFERGRQQNNLPHLDLVEISNNMHKYRNFMRVHWSGVHYWLSADIKLRQLSQNKQSLDTVLNQLKDCGQNQSLSAEEISKKFDELVRVNQPDVNIFKPAFDKYKASHATTDPAPLLVSLGVNYNHKDALILSTVALNADIRKRIFIGNGY